MISTLDQIDPQLLDVFPVEHDGYPDELAAEDTRDVLMDVCGSASRAFPDSWKIEPRDWVDVAVELDERKAWGMNRLDRYTHQGAGYGRKGTHECTCHSLVAGFSVARNKQRGVLYPEGPRKDLRSDRSVWSGSVWLSPLSVYAEANPRQWGGANVRQVLEIAFRRGILPDRTQPRDYGFSHTLTGTSGRGNTNQSGGDWLSLSRFPSGWQGTAELFRPLEVIFPESFEEAACCVLRGYAVCVGRNGHAVPWTFWNARTRAFGYPDSYDVTRYDSEATARNAWRGSFCIVSTTTPGDWSNPAELTDDPEDRETKT